MKAIEVYAGSDGDLTKRYYAELEKAGPWGIVAVNLFRAQKNSARAKVYRGGGYRSAAYDRKAWAMENLISVLASHAPLLAIDYGWKADPETLFGDRASWVLYIDLPQGQVSFHSPTRMAGPDYRGEFDGAHKSAERIIQFCDAVWARLMATP